MPTSPWIPVTERLPPFDERVIVTDGVDVTLGSYHRGLLGRPRRWHLPYGWDIEVSHWMPLPPLPSEAA